MQQPQTKERKLKYLLYSKFLNNSATITHLRRRWFKIFGENETFPFLPCIHLPLLNFLLVLLPGKIPHSPAPPHPWGYTGSLGSEQTLQLSTTLRHVKLCLPFCCYHFFPWNKYERYCWTRKAPACLLTLLGAASRIELQPYWLQ